VWYGVSWEHLLDFIEEATFGVLFEGRELVKEADLDAGAFMLEGLGYVKTPFPGFAGGELGVGAWVTEVGLAETVESGKGGIPGLGFGFCREDAIDHIDGTMTFLGGEVVTCPFVFDFDLNRGAFKVDAESGGTPQGGQVVGPLDLVGAPPRFPLNLRHVAVITGHPFFCKGGGGPLVGGLVLVVAGLAEFNRSQAGFCEGFTSSLGFGMDAQDTAVGAHVTSEAVDALVRAALPGEGGLGQPRLKKGAGEVAVLAFLLPKIAGEFADLGVGVGDGVMAFTPFFPELGMTGFALP
jgi:hypothetical protein